MKRTEEYSKFPNATASDNVSGVITAGLFIRRNYSPINYFFVFVSLLTVTATRCIDHPFHITRVL